MTGRKATGPRGTGARGRTALLPGGATGKPRLGALPEFLIEVLLARFDVVLTYDLGNGTRVEKGGERFAEWPAMKDKTLPGYETSSFYGVGAPRGTPREIVRLLNREISDAIGDGAIRRAFDDLGADPIVADADRFNAMFVAETERWRKIVALAAPSVN